MTGEEFGFLFRDIMGLDGVLDVYYTPILMKKNRPGILLTVLCVPSTTEEIEKYLLINSSTFGVRTSIANRNILKRSFEIYHSALGDIKIKLGSLDGQIIKAIPEYNDVAKISEKNGEVFSKIYRDAEVFAEKLINGVMVNG